MKKRTAQKLRLNKIRVSRLNASTEQQYGNKLPTTTITVLSRRFCETGTICRH